MTAPDTITFGAVLTRSASRPTCIDTQQHTNARPTRSLVLAPFFDLNFANNRPRAVAEVLAEFGPVDVVTTGFDHLLKVEKPRTPWIGARETIYLPTPMYRANVSVRRFWSHIAFARRAIAYVRAHREAYDVVYATAPLNLLAARAFGEAADCVRVLDVVDVWPDVLPFPRAIRRLAWPAFAAWKRLFRIACARADALLAVSDTFLAEALPSFGGPTGGARRVYIGQPPLPPHVRSAVGTRRRIAYVGNIGWLYDFETLLDALDTPDRRDVYELHVIGRGDREEWLRAELQRRGLAYQFHGVVTELGALAAVLGECHVAFNGYRNTGAAFSYKATTYLAAGLPLINSMTGDLERLVRSRGLGANYRESDSASLAAALDQLAAEPADALRQRCLAFFDAEISSVAVAAQLREFLTEQITAKRVSRTA